MTTPQAVGYREIPLTRGQVALVDAEDYEELSKHRWYAHWEKKTKTFYAARNRSRSLGRGVIWMHRQILGLEHGDPRTGDHAFHCTLDNRKFVDGRVNLRIASKSQQQHNHRLQQNNTSGFKGVSFNEYHQKYAARIKVGGRQHHLGYRTSAKDAAVLVQEATKRLHGEFGYQQQLVSG